METFGHQTNKITLSLFVIKQQRELDQYFTIMCMSVSAFKNRMEGIGLEVLMEATLHEV